MCVCVCASLRLQKRYGVEPDLLCVPPQLLLYMALAPEEKILYKEGGPSAVANFEAGVEGYKTRQYRGMGVVTSDPVRQMPSSHLNTTMDVRRPHTPRAVLTAVCACFSLRSRTTSKRFKCCNGRHRSGSSTSWDHQRFRLERMMITRTLW